MTDTVQIELIRTIPGVIGSIGAAAAAWFSYRAATHSKETLAVSKQTAQNTNGMKDELVKLTGEASKAQGKLEGKLEGRVEVVNEIVERMKVDTKPPEAKKK